MGRMKKISETIETIAEAFDSVYATCEELRDGMHQWGSGLESTKQNQNYKKTELYRMIKAAKYDMESVLVYLDNVDIPEDLEGLEITFDNIKEKFRPEKIQNAVTRLNAIQELLKPQGVDVSFLIDTIEVLELVHFPRAFGKP